MSNNKNNKLDLEFSYLGHRDYVHGSSMLEGLIECISNYVGFDNKTTKIKMFKVIKEFNSFAWAEAMPMEEAQNHQLLNETVARLDLMVDGKGYTSLLFPKPAEPVTNRIESYDAKNYVMKIKTDQDGRYFGTLTKINNLIDLARGIVEVNRQISWLEAGDTEISKMRWAYLSDFPLLNDKSSSLIKEVRFKHKGNLESGDDLFVVKSVQIDLLGDDYDPSICFYIQKK